MISQVASAIKDATGSYTNAYYLSAIMLVVAAVLMIFLKSPQPQVEKVMVPIAELAVD